MIGSVLLCAIVQYSGCLADRISKLYDGSGISRTNGRETSDLQLSGNLGAHRDLRSLYLLVRLVSVHDMYARLSLSRWNVRGPNNKFF